jgi:hypothetical protein
LTKEEFLFVKIDYFTFTLLASLELDFFSGGGGSSRSCSRSRDLLERSSFDRCRSDRSGSF